jgi:hypothetical protein
MRWARPRREAPSGLPPGRATRAALAAAARAAPVALAACLLASCATPPVYRADQIDARAMIAGIEAFAEPGTAGARLVSGRRDSLFGGNYAYEIWEPAEATDETLPGTLFLAHGFGRDLKAMRGWARHLASHGLRTVVPSLRNSTFYAGRHDRNGADLLDLARALEPGTRYYAGFSAGGLASLIAASRDEGSALWLGLDPVDSGGLAAGALAALGARGTGALPAARAMYAILGEKSACNAQGNFEPLLRSAGVPFERVAAATHCAFENPYDPACEAICGRAEPPEAAEAIRAYILARATSFLVVR